MSGKNGGKPLSQLIAELSGENIYRCYQCQRCTNGCPFAEFFDIPPHELIRRLQFGQDDVCLTAKTTWLCAACQTCNTRCPQDIDVARVFDIVKIEAQERGLKPAAFPVKAFYDAGMRNIRWFGRLYELGLMAELYGKMFFRGELNLRRLFSKDLPMALRMLRAGKLKIFPTIARGSQTRPIPKPAGKKAIGYYPGCSLHATAIEFGKSMEMVAEALDLALIEPNGWVCCGTSPAHSSDHVLATALPIENLALIEKAGCDAVTVPCASCFSRFKMAVAHMDDNADLKREVEELVRKRRGFIYHGGVDVQHILETFEEFVGLDAIRERVRRPLKGLKFVSYYGCLITRPPKVTEAPNPENPMNMEHIIEALGGENLDWNYKTACCGGSLSLSELDMALSMIGRIVGEAREVGADAIVVACPLCHANLDMRQDMLESAEKPIPVVYITELMGLAFGIPPKELGLDKHLAPTDALVQRALGEPARV